MNRRPAKISAALRMVTRAALLAAVIVGPLAAVHNVEAGSSSIIESSLKHGSGAGLVLMVGLQRS
jgi:hypothetical protein